MSSRRRRCANSCASTPRDAGITTLLTSHYMQDIAELCERVILIDHGKLFFDGPLKDIIDQLATPQDRRPSRGTRGLRETDFRPYGEVLEKSQIEVQLKGSRKRKIVPTSRDLIAALEVDGFLVEDVPIENIIREVFTTRQG